MALLLVAGIGGWALFTQSGLPDPVVYGRADIGTLLLIVSLGACALIGIISLAARRVEVGKQREIDRLHQWATEERQRFLRRLDHETKNPLTAIRASLANLTTLHHDEPTQALLAEVDTQTQRLSRLVNDLRKLADLETRPIDLVQTNLADLLQEAVRLHQERPEAAERRLILTLPQAPWPLTTILADEDLLVLAVYNLLDNAIKYSMSDSTIEVRASEDSKYVVIEVADTGLGIPDSELPHIWEELARGEHTRGIPGSGLGLSLVRVIVERHGGQAAVRSRPGQGTVFSLRIPLHSSP
jgi:two-component system OmpR family sensor kinase